MPTYTWRNKTTGEVVDVQRPIAEASTPPDVHDGSCELESESAYSGRCTCWERVFSFGVGRVEGGGSSPARTSTRSK